MRAVSHGWSCSHPSLPSRPHGGGGLAAAEQAAARHVGARGAAGLPATFGVGADDVRRLRRLAPKHCVYGVDRSAMAPTSPRSRGAWRPSSPGWPAATSTTTSRSATRWWASLPRAPWASRWIAVAAVRVLSAVAPSAPGVLTPRAPVGIQNVGVPTTANAGQWICRSHRILVLVGPAAMARYRRRYHGTGAGNLRQPSRTLWIHGLRRRTTGRGHQLAPALRETRESATNARGPAWPGVDGLVVLVEARPAARRRRRATAPRRNPSAPEARRAHPERRREFVRTARPRLRTGPPARRGHPPIVERQAAGEARPAGFVFPIPRRAFAWVLATASLPSWSMRSDRATPLANGPAMNSAPCTRT
jgi:hypothetical protein